jgi:hypothetical protein
MQTSTECTIRANPLPKVELSNEGTLSTQRRGSVVTDADAGERDEEERQGLLQILDLIDSVRCFSLLNVCNFPSLWIESLTFIIVSFRQARLSMILLQK